jgi:hypothetical protein
MPDCMLCGGRGRIDEPEISGTCPECEGVGCVTGEERSRQEGDAECLRAVLRGSDEAWKRN